MNEINNTVQHCYHLQFVTRHPFCGFHRLRNTHEIKWGELSESNRFLGTYNIPILSRLIKYKMVIKSQNIDPEFLVFKRKVHKLEILWGTFGVPYLRRKEAKREPSQQ